MYQAAGYPPSVVQTRQYALLWKYARKNKGKTECWDSFSFFSNSITFVPLPISPYSYFASPHNMKYPLGFTVLFISNFSSVPLSQNLLSFFFFIPFFFTFLFKSSQFFKLFRRFDFSQSCEERGLVELARELHLIRQVITARLS